MTLELLQRKNEYAVRFRNNKMYSWVYLSPKHVLNEFPYKKSLDPVWLSQVQAEIIYRAVEEAIAEKGSSKVSTVKSTEIDSTEFCLSLTEDGEIENANEIP